mmetsp:Transcript_36370/g.35990  ORF Transcript_36370/g.35990 Transcript_36370/m.35990 type:complete len:181 (-) Transcript_36370:80-622(-)
MPTDNVSKPSLPKVRRTKQIQNRQEGINQTKCQNNIYCGLKRKVPSSTVEVENLNSEKPLLNFEKRDDEGSDIKIIKKSQSLNTFRFKELVMKKIKTQNDLSLDFDKVDDPFDLDMESSLRMKRSKSMLKPIFSFCPPAPHNTTKFYCQLRELPSLPNFNKIDEVSDEESDSFNENSPDT